MVWPDDSRSCSPLCMEQKRWHQKRKLYPLVVDFRMNNSLDSVLVDFHRLCMVKIIFVNNYEIMHEEVGRMHFSRAIKVGHLN